MASKPIDSGFVDHVEDHEAIYRRAMAKAEEFKRAAEVGEYSPNPVQGGPDTPGRTSNH